MNPFKPLIVFSILIITLFSACSEKDEFAPYLKGDIIGYAFCYDEYSNDLEDYSGIKVVTDPDRKYSAVTDKNGRYVLKNVLNGTYDLSFEKEGFGTMKMFGIQHLGGKPTIISYHYSDDYVIIYENITSHITAIYYQNDSLLADLAFSGEYRPGSVYIRLLFSTQENFVLQSAEASKSIELWESLIKYKSRYGNVSVGLPFAHGEKVYCKAAIYSDHYFYYDFIGINKYYDFETGTTIYPNLSNENYEFSFTMP
jgi:hypothetical protein